MEIQNMNDVNKISSLWEAEIGSISFCGGSQNAVYKYNKNKKDYIIRFTPATNRTYNELLSEIDFVNFVCEKGFYASKPVKSINTFFLEKVVIDKKDFYVSSFECALGTQPTIWNRTFFKQLGEMVGNLHALSKEYKKGTKMRFDWYENVYIKNVEQYIPNQPLVIMQLNKLITNIKTLPIYNDSYGLIHGDILGCNFNYYQNKLTLFDFDELQYCYYINDIAIQFFYSSIGMNGKNDEEYIEEFVEYFMKGYLRQTNIDSKWLSVVPLFLKLREFILYIGVLRYRDLNNLDDWTKGFMDGRKEKLENNIPFLKNNIFNKFK